MKLIKILFFCLLSFKLFGTAQIPDILIYEGDTLMLYSQKNNTEDDIRSGLEDFKLFLNNERRFVIYFV